MSFPWQILISTAGAGSASLAGVAVGAALSSRSQRRHWARDKQIDACKAIVVESTRAQIGLRQTLTGGDAVDWAGWNEALAFTWLVCSPDVAHAARLMDEVFWRYGARIKDKQLIGEEAWGQARDAMEKARLMFINVARVEITGWDTPLAEVPNARPPLSERSGRSEPTA